MTLTRSKGAVMAVMGMAEKKPAAEIWAMEKEPSAEVPVVLRTMVLPRSYPQNETATAHGFLVSTGDSRSRGGGVAGHEGRLTYTWG